MGKPRCVLPNPRAVDNKSDAMTHKGLNKYALEKYRRHTSCGYPSASRSLSRRVFYLTWHISEMIFFESVVGRLAGIDVVGMGKLVFTAGANV